MSESLNVNGQLIELVLGDITDQRVDAIVNAANSHLASGAGVDGAIHRRAGPSIMKETRHRYPNGCPTGSAVISSAGDLTARFVVHAVGPIWHGGGSDEAVGRSCAKRNGSLVERTRFSATIPTRESPKIGSIQGRKKVCKKISVGA